VALIMSRIKTFLSRRFNPRLHPLLAVSLGLALLGLLLPAAPREGENHSPGELLDLLIGPELDFEHGPAFWLREAHEDTALYHQAGDLCRDRSFATAPNCQVFSLVMGLVGPPPPSLPSDPGGTP
jgi:hypothetical protein